jgi:hypothetical protein
MGDALGVKICDPSKKLFETAFDLAGAHLTPFDRAIEIPTRTILHDLAPMMLLVLDQVDCLNNVGVVQCRGDTELGSEFLHVFLFCLVLPPLAEFLLG